MRAKTLLEHVRERSFRPDRHGHLLLRDRSIEDELTAHERGEIALSESEYRWLDWLTYWQCVATRVGMRWPPPDRRFVPFELVEFVRVLNGRVPPGEPPYLDHLEDA